MPLLKKIKQSVKSYMDASSLLRPLLHRYLSFRGDRKYRQLQANCFKMILEKNRINVLLDVGAHAGETGAMFRGKYGYAGRIISFEPIHEKLLLLQQKALTSPPWEGKEMALGNESGSKIFTVFDNAYNSSFLPHHEFLEKECHLGQKRMVEVQIRRLEDLYPSLCFEEDSVLLKIDTQGFEKQILEGTGKYLSKIRLVKLEASLVPCYQGEALLGEIIQYMEAKGFSPVLIEPGHISETHFQLQADVIFQNRNG